MHLAQGSVVARAFDATTTGGSRFADRVRQGLRGATPEAKVVLALVFAVLFVTPIADHVIPFLVPSPLWGGTEGYCDTHKLGCDLTTHLLADGALAVAAYFAFWRRTMRTKTVWRMRAWVGPGSGGLTDLAAERATEGGPLLVRLTTAAWRKIRRTSPLVDSILGRDELVREIASALDSGSQPQVIIADSSAGKTMVLVRLADWLARRGQVPMLISLQGQENLDFEQLARAAFASVLPDVDRQELDKQWALLRHRGQITLLADDLDKAAINPAEARQALQEAADAKLRLVVASRAYALPPDFREGRIDLLPLQTHEVTVDLLRLARRAGVATSQRAIEHIVDGAQIGATPYYLSLARVLVWQGKLSAPPADEDVRLWLMSQYRVALETRELRSDARLSVEYRRDALKALEAIAFARVAGNRTAEDISEILGSYEIDTNVPEVVAAGRRLGVLRPSESDEVRFAHPATLAYFASCFLAERKGDEAFWKYLSDQPWGPFRALTLVLATTAAADRTVARRVCLSLLRETPNSAASARSESCTGPSWLDAAVEIARRNKGIDQDTARTLLRRVDSKLREISEDGQEQIRLLKALGGLCEKVWIPGAYELLTEYAATSHYAIRRQATKALARGVRAADVLLPIVEDVILHAERCQRRLAAPLDDDRSNLFECLKTVAWILPSLRSTADASAKERLDSYQARLGMLAQSVTKQRGLEASIAQGLKFDAVRNPQLAPDEFAMAMLEKGTHRAQFWFSRLLLVQALALRCRHHRTRRAARLIRTARFDEHVFVRQAAKLCRRALHSARPERYLFEDATEAAAKAPYELSWKASQLVGDVVLALNLNERGTPQSRIAFGEAKQLPACLTSTRDRRAVVENEKFPALKTCPFAHFKEGECLCPYTYDSPNSDYRRELTRAFCRHQRLNARRVPWHHRLKVKDVRDFWSGMEDTARY